MPIAFLFNGVPGARPRDRANRRTRPPADRARRPDDRRGHRPRPVRSPSFPWPARHRGVVAMDTLASEDMRADEIAEWPQERSAAADLVGEHGKNREISDRAGMRGGPERTRTACQARSPIEPVSESYVPSSQELELNLVVIRRWGPDGE